MGPLRCPFCHDDLDGAPGDGVRTDCAGCGAPHHRGCFAELGRCAATGCGGRSTSSAARFAAPQQVKGAAESAWWAGPALAVVGAAMIALAALACDGPSPSTRARNARSAALALLGLRPEDRVQAEGYTFEAGGGRWVATAEPTEPGVSGDWYLALDRDGRLEATTERRFGVDRSPAPAASDEAWRVHSDLSARTERLLGGAASLLAIGVVLALVAFRRERPDWRPSERACTCALVALFGGPCAAFLANECRSAVKSGNETSAIMRLKQVGEAEVRFAREVDGAGRAASLEVLAATGLLDPAWTPPSSHGYRVRLAVSRRSPALWVAIAEPIEPGRTGDRTLVATAGGIRYTTAAADPLPLDPDGDLAPVTTQLGR